MLTLVTGGAASGKSEYAEELACKCPEPRIYLAAMQRSAAAEERIRKHIERRKGQGFRTVEDPYLSEPVFSDKAEKIGVVLLEDLPNLLVNRLFSLPEDRVSEQERMEEVLQTLKTDLSRLNEQTEQLIVVSGDLFRDGKRYSGETQKYLELLGELHRFLAERADRIVEVVCGIPIHH